MNISTKIPLKVKGEFEISIIRENGIEEVVCPWFGNMVLDNGLTQILGSGFDKVAICFVGTGNSTPEPGQTALDNRIAQQGRGTGDHPRISSGITGRIWNGVRIEYLFALGAVVGNISEIGVGNSVANGLISRSLIKDVLGNPTTITILAGERLRVTYRLMMYLPEETTNEVLISGVPYEVRTRIQAYNSSYGSAWWKSSIAAIVGDSNSWPTSAKYGLTTNPDRFNAPNAAPGAGCPTPNTWARGEQLGGGVEVTSEAVVSPIPGAIARKAIITISDTVGNGTGGLNWFLWQGGFCYIQFHFTPAVPKDADHRLILEAVYTLQREEEE